MRISLARREAAGYIKLRRLGYSMSVLSTVFGRSTSVIHRILKRAKQYDPRSFPLDMRKLPTHVRRVGSVLQRQRLRAMIKAWEAWMLGEGEDPP